MYERFTDRARKVMQLANQEAQRFNHEYIGTEHILLGLVQEGSGVAANVLTNLDVDLRKIRREIEKVVQHGPDTVMTDRLPQTPRAKRVIEYAILEARQLDHNYIGTEHLLLGLLREGDGVAGQVLMNLGLKLDTVRELVLNLLGGAGDPREVRSRAVPVRTSGQVNPLVLRLLTEIYRIPILDSHSHIDPHAPAARSFDDILGYHYYTELAHSAGLDAQRVGSDVPPADRVAAVGQFLPALENTVQYAWLFEIARTFFGFEGEELRAGDMPLLAERAAQVTARPEWAAQVLQVSGIEKIVLTNDFDDPLEGFDTGRYVPCLRTDDLVFRLDDRATVERLNRATGASVGDCASLAAALRRLFEHFKQHGARACAISLPPDFEPLPVTRGEVEPPLGGILAGRSVTADERRTVERYVFWTLAGLCADFALPFDLMIGVRRRVYRAGVHQGQDLFDQRTSLYQYRELFNAFPRVKFPVSVLSSGQNQELVSYAWIFPNVLTHGHWWYSNVPAYIEPDLRARLLALPCTKQLGYYSDAYRLEFILPKFNMYRRVLAAILAQDYVIGRGWSEERAVALAQRVLHDNVRSVFGL